MKTILVLLTLAFSTSIAAKDVFHIYCNGGDCFTHGWEMWHKADNGEEVHFLSARCDENDCRKKGWKSQDVNGDAFIVGCQKEDCFKYGWFSINYVDGVPYQDIATCKHNDCLKYGWTVETGYDNWGGDVTCGNYDCSRFGGAAFWRGHASKTVCMDMDCYGKGWILTIFSEK